MTQIYKSILEKILGKDIYEFHVNNLHGYDFYGSIVASSAKMGAMRCANFRFGKFCDVCISEK